MEEKISVEDLKAFLKLKSQAQTAINASEIAAAQARIADLECTTFLQGLYLRHGMGLQDQIDEFSGEILRKRDAPRDAPRDTPSPDTDPEPESKFTKEEK